MIEAVGIGIFIILFFAAVGAPFLIVWEEDQKTKKMLDRWKAEDDAAASVSNTDTDTKQK